MPITDQDKIGLEDLFRNDEQSACAAKQIARSITQNVCNIETIEDALEIIYLHIGDAIEILNKRSLTKDILFRYLHERQIAVKSDFTKSKLIYKIKEYWHNLQIQENDTNEYQGSSSLSSFQEEPQYQQPTSNSEQHPIALLALGFTEWFFNKVNNNDLKPVDVWIDVQLKLNIINNGISQYEELQGAEQIVEVLLNSKISNNISFNPNLTSNGVQGRMDSHGMVVIVSCGTVHNPSKCLGVFDATFSLIRDPLSENNWKVKRFEISMKTTTVPALPNVYNNESFREILALPMTPRDELG